MREATTRAILYLPKQAGGSLLETIGRTPVHQSPTIQAPSKEILVTLLNPAATAFNQTLPVLDEQTLLRELNHRVNNELASAINLVSVAAVRAEGSEAKAALTNVVDLLHGYADVHRALVTPDRGTLTDAGGYARKLGFAMSRSLLSRMNIGLTCVADTLPLAS